MSLKNPVTPPGIDPGTGPHMYRNRRYSESPTNHQKWKTSVASIAQSVTMPNVRITGDWLYLSQMHYLVPRNNSMCWCLLMVDDSDQQRASNWS